MRRGLEARYPDELVGRKIGSFITEEFRVSTSSIHDCPTTVGLESGGICKRERRNLCLIREHRLCQNRPREGIIYPRILKQEGAFDQARCFGVGSRSSRWIAREIPRCCLVVGRRGGRRRIFFVRRRFIRWCRTRLTR